MSLWSDENKLDDILKSDDVFLYIDAVVNLYEDIQVLKEDNVELEAKLQARTYPVGQGEG